MSELQNVRKTQLATVGFDNRREPKPRNVGGL